MIYVTKVSLLVLSIVFIVVIIVFAGLDFWQQEQPMPQVQSSSSILPPPEPPPPSVGQNMLPKSNVYVSTEGPDAEGWYTYVENDIGFEFKYPGDWDVLRGSGGSTAGPTAEEIKYPRVIYLDLRPKSMTLDSIFRIEGSFEPLDQAVEYETEFFQNNFNKTLILNTVSIKQGRKVKVSIPETNYYNYYIGNNNISFYLFSGDSGVVARITRADTSPA